MRNKISFNGSEVTGIKYGTFHYSASAGELSTVRPGGIYASFIEFEYYLDNGVTLAVGDVITYSQVTDVDKTFAPVTTDREIVVNNFNVIEIAKHKSTCYVLAYDDTIKLNVDYSSRLKSLENSFPMAIGDLIDDISTFTGVTFSFDNVGNVNDYQSIRNTTVNYFYASGITAREIIGSIVSLRWCYMVCQYNNGSPRLYASNRWSTATGWKNNFEYIICPDDTDYSYTSSGLDYAKYNVWYKEHGLEYGDDIPDFDGVEIYDSNGAMLGHYYEATPPTNVYTVSENIIAQNVNTFYTSTYADYGYDYWAENIYWCLDNYTSQRIASAKLFPFRSPLWAGSTAYCVNTDGTKFHFPIVSIDLTDAECVIFSPQMNAVSSSGDAGDGAGDSGLWAQINQIQSAVNPLRTDTLTDTTNAYGNIFTTLDENCTILSAIRTDGAASVCTPFWIENLSVWGVHVAGMNASAVASTSVTVKIVYLQSGVAGTLYYLVDANGNYLTDSDGNKLTVTA